MEALEQETSVREITEEATGPQLSGEGGFGRHLRDLLAPYGLVIFLVLLLIGFSLDMPHTFFTAGNFRAMVTSQSTLLIMALGLTWTLRADEFDLSIGSVMIFSASLTAVLNAQDHMSPAGAILIGVAVAMIIGVINGMLTVMVGLSAFVTTLASMSLIEGLAFAITNDQVISGISPGVLAFSRDKILGLPYATYYGWILALIMWYLYEWTPLGRYHFVIGQDRSSAQLIGLPVRRIRILGFIGASVFCGFAGVTLTGTLGAVDPTIGPQFLLQPFGAAFLGATTIRLGQFNVFGTVIGLYLLSVGVTGLQLMGAAPWVGEVFNGAALLVAVFFARLAGRRALS